MPTPLLQRPTILTLDAPPTLEPPEAPILSGQGIDAQWIEFGALAKDEQARALREADIILTWRTPVDAAMLEQARRCLVVIHYGAGIGANVGRVDMEQARRLGIYVASVPDFAADSWAGETLRLIRRLTGGDIPVLPKRALRGLRLGVIGLGSVGRLVARQGQALGMEVWACDPFAPQATFDHDGILPADLANLMGIADIISLHVPLGPATAGLLGAEQFALMKTGSLLVNSAAPQLVDCEVLAAALKRRRPLAAAFDEDLATLLSTGHPLLAQPTLFHGPRQAGQAPECAVACRRQTANLIVQILLGNRPAHLLIDPPCPRHILLMAGQSWS